MTEETADGAGPPPRRRDDGLVVSGASMALPQRFGPYVVDRSLARGGMGAVLLVRHEKLGAEYALKVIPDATLDADAFVRFEREIQALVALSGHPHIVAVHACGVESGRPWYVMDRIEGESLEKALADEPLSIRAAIRLGAQMASALEAAHARGLLHRDVKPANILLVGDLETPEGRAVLCDFGLATSSTGDLTKTGEILGTPAFLSPEQALGEKEKLGPHTDVFGLGAVLYYALIRERPFGRGSTSTVSALAAVLHDKLRMPRNERPDIPEALEAVLVRALEKDPARRFSSAAEMRAALDAIRIAKSEEPRSERAAVIAGLLLLLGAAAAIAASLWLLSRPRTPASPPASPPTSPPSPQPAPRQATPVNVTAEERARAELDAALATADEKRLVTADRLIREAGSAWSPDDDLRVARRILLAKKPVAAIRRAIGGRIPDDPKERDDLAALALEAAGTEERQDLDRLALVGQEAAMAGLSVAPIASRLDQALVVIVTSERPPTGIAFETARRAAVTATCLRRRTAVIDDVAASDTFRLLSRPPQDPGTVEERIDYNGLVPEALVAGKPDGARLLVRTQRVAAACAALEEMRAAQGETERFALAEIEILVHTRPLVALEKLGQPAPPGESVARQILRADAHTTLFRGTRSPDFEREMIAHWKGIIDRALERANVDARQHYVATRAYTKLVDAYIAIHRWNHARAWFARGRIALGGGGREFSEWRWSALFEHR